MDFELITVISLITVGICYAIVKTIKNDIWEQKKRINDQESALRRKESALHRREVALTQQEERVNLARLAYSGYIYRGHVFRTSNHSLRV